MKCVAEFCGCERMTDFLSGMRSVYASETKGIFIDDDGATRIIIGRYLTATDRPALCPMKWDRPAVIISKLTRRFLG